MILERLLPEPRVIYDREGGTPYLSRWYLIGAHRDPDPELAGQSSDRGGLLHRLPFNLFLHKFHRSDDDGALHSHPWAWAVSLVLSGGYSEERRVGDRVERRLVLPGRLNVLTHDTYHRVDLVDGPAWTLFLVGPRRNTWYFWDRHTRRRCQWRAYIQALRGLAPDAPWEPDAREAP